MRGTAETPDLILSGEIGVNKTVNTESLNIYENGNYTPPAGVDGYDDIHVDVRPVIDQITIRENGTYAASGEVDGYSPIVVNVPQSAAKVYAKNINANGNYYPDAGYDGFSQVSVNVPATPLRPLNVTENGEYNPPTGEGYSSVSVDVPTDPEIESITITENGTYTAPTGVDGYSPVIVNVPQPEDAYYIKDMTPGAISSFDDGADMVLPSLIASIVPVQDLHGYDSPWVGGAGKNKLPLTVDNIKNANSSITWRGNEATKSGVTFKIETDNNGNVSGVKLNGTATDDIQFLLGIGLIFNGDYILNGGLSANISVAIQGKVLSAGADRAFTDDGTTRRTSWIFVESGTVCNNVVKPMVRLASVSDSTFEPYENICPIIGWTEETITVTDDLQNPTVTHTTTIPFTDGQGQSVEVFGGSVDVVNGGEQQRTLGKIIVDENTTIYTGSSGMPFRISVDNIKSSTSASSLLGLLSNQMKEVAQEATWGDECTMSVTTTTGRIYFKLTNDITTVADLKTHLAQHPIEIVYPLATPTTFYTQPTSIKSLDGDNNVWASTGDVLSGSYFSETPA